MNDIFNNLIISLSNSLSKLLDEACSETHGYDPIVYFGKHKRAKQVAEVMFNLVLGYGNVCSAL